MVLLDTKTEEFIAKIIHDLKTPINAQIKALESFLSTARKKITQEEKDLIELTLNSCNYMQKLTEIFISIHKLKEGKLLLNYEKFNLVDLIEQSIQELNILLKYYELKVVFNKKRKCIINADKLQIKRVIENLLSNSINFAFKNSTIEINLLNYKRNIAVTITTKSAFIEQDILKEIFNKYSTNNKSSSGLGLYLSQEIIKTHNGIMIAKSNSDDINIFGFEIPID